MKELKNQLEIILAGEQLTLTKSVKNHLAKVILEYAKAASTNDKTRRVFYQYYKQMMGYEDSTTDKSHNDSASKLKTISKKYRKIQRLNNKFVKNKAKGGCILPAILQESLSVIPETEDKPFNKLVPMKISSPSKMTPLAK